MFKNFNFAINLCHEPDLAHSRPGQRRQRRRRFLTLNGNDLPRLLCSCCSHPELVYLPVSVGTAGRVLFHPSDEDFFCITYFDPPPHYSPSPSSIRLAMPPASGRPSTIQEALPKRRVSGFSSATFQPSVFPAPPRHAASRFGSMSK